MFSGLADLFGTLQWWCFGVAARITDRLEPDPDRQRAWEHFQELTGWSKGDFMDPVDDKRV